ncbi:MAG TPA: hypothetical protein VHW44_03230 [Pseudonocardiaceae bacterium]|jgi:hypothetical protein|nr:hypothetical protein [Pseudonocardiaceae bacterium]
MSFQRSGRDAARSLTRMFTDPVWNRVERIAAKHSALASERADRRFDEVWGRLDGSGRDIDRAHGRLDEVAGWHTDLATEFRNLRDRVGKLEHELSRVGAQLGALDTRVAKTERPAVVTTDGPPPAEAVALLDEIRAEHQRVRARLAAVASYEERIGRLETPQAARPA